MKRWCEEMWKKPKQRERKKTMIKRELASRTLCRRITVFNFWKTKREINFKKNNNNKKTKTKKSHLGRTEGD